MTKTEIKTMELITFGMETLGYKHDYQADNFFKKKFNEFWELAEDNNTGTMSEIMTFSKAKSSKGSKLQDWYNAQLEELLKDVFAKSVDETIERTTFIREKAPKKATPKKEKVVGGTNLKDTKPKQITKTDEEILSAITQ